MTSINLDGVSSLALIKAETKVNLDGVSALALIYTPPDDSTITKLKFLNYLNTKYNLGYQFDETNHMYWNLSPVYLQDPSDKKRSVVRVSALDGNGKYSGYRDIIYNRIDIADYLSTLEPISHMTQRFRDSSERETIRNLIAQEFSDGELQVDEVTEGDITIFTLTVTDVNSPLWYGQAVFQIGDIPEFETVIKLNSFVMSD